MNLIISEKNIAARRIAEILAVGKPTAEKVYTTPVYRFRRGGEDWVSIGLKGHIMEVDFAPVLDEAAVRELAAADPRVLAGGAESVLAAEGGVDLKKWRLETLPVLTRVHVEKVPKEKGIIQSIKNLAKKADKVVIATDFDREGELIGADARDVVRSVNADVPVTRVRFSAITKDEIERAFAEEDTLSEELAQAGETRQDIDLIWGAVLTRYLTLALQTQTKRPFGDVLSSGRVQTPTLKLIVDREKEREAFVPEDYWVVRGTFSVSGDEFVAPHATDRFKSEEAARAVVDAVADATTATVASVDRSKRKVQPPTPFNTTALMAAAASEGISPAQTMRIAESLYMSGYMSYPRVDNTVYPPSLDLKGILKSLAEVPFYREHAQKLLGAPLHPTRGPKETTDHPPIHPTGAADPDKLDPQAWKLYNLVARRFMATLSDAAVVESTKVGLDVTGERFQVKGDVVVSPGFRAIYPYGLRKDDHLPTMAEGETIDFGGAEMEGKQTQPPARYSQGKLIQEMEKLGLGTKATRHDAIQTLYDRKYVQNDPMEPTNKGHTVIDALSTYASEITTPDMTVALDAEMDAIANGKSTLPAVVGHSQNALATVVEELLGNVEPIAEMLKGAIDEDAKVGVCPKSGHDLLIKYSPRNRTYFVGCTGYPECDVTYPLPKNAKYQAVEELCEVCGSPQVRIIQFKKRPRVMCLSPDCPTKKGPEIMIAKGGCPADGCGGDLRVVYSAVGSRYVRCTNYETCKTAYPLPQQGEIEPTEELCECGVPKVIVHTKKGPWKICIDPDCPHKPERNTGRRGASGRAGGTKKATGAKKPAAKKAAATRKAAPATKPAAPKKPSARKKSSDS